MNTQHTHRNRRKAHSRREALSLCRENARISENNLSVGSATTAKNAETLATLKKAEMQDLAASLDYRLALAELQKTIGSLAPTSGN